MSVAELLMELTDEADYELRVETAEGSQTVKSIRWEHDAKHCVIELN